MNKKISVAIFIVLLLSPVFAQQVIDHLGVVRRCLGQEPAAVGAQALECDLREHGAGARVLRPHELLRSGVDE